MQLADILDRLAALPRSQRLALYALTYVAIGALFWFMVYTPSQVEAADLQAQNNELVQTKATVKARAENREQFEEELAQLKNDLKQALRELPNDREIPELLKRISAIGKKAGLEIRKFQPLPEVKAEYYAEVPVALEVYGSYHEVAMFFDRLSKLGRIVYVQDIEMDDADDRAGKVFLEVSGKAVTFRFLTEEEQAAAREQAGRRGKRGKKGGK
jgi:type IV pilus assembly protein PilO